MQFFFISRASWLKGISCLKGHLVPKAFFRKDRIKSKLKFYKSQKFLLLRGKMMCIFTTETLRSVRIYEKNEAIKNKKYYLLLLQKHKTLKFK